jgi:hypothetical protein
MEWAVRMRNWLASLFMRICRALFPRLSARAEALTEIPMPAEDETPATHYRPKPGFVWNPLKKCRNLQCLCGRPRKVKNCCGRHEALPVDVAQKVMRALKSKGLV